MTFWNSIKEKTNNVLRNKYNTTDKKDEIAKKVYSGKTVEVTRPTSVRSFSKNGNTWVGGDVSVGSDKGDRNVDIASTAIESARYDPEHNRAYITFVGGGKEYEYNVSPSEFESFLNADSKGQYVSTRWNNNPKYHI